MLLLAYNDAAVHVTVLENRELASVQPQSRPSVAPNVTPFSSSGEAGRELGLVPGGRPARASSDRLHSN